MKSLIVSVIFLCTIFVMAPYTGIANESETAEQTQIAFLIEMIEKLQSQLSELLDKRGLSQVAPPKVEESLLLRVDYCPDIDRVLERGISGSDVKELQEFLRSTGDYTYSESTGYYGQLTETAVKNFQKRASVVSSGDAITTGYGTFGPLTRKAIFRYCKPVAPNPDPVACTMEYDPVCGQPPAPPTPPCVEGQACAVYDQPLPKTYSNKCHMSVAGAEYLYSGECRVPGDGEDVIPDNCKVWYDGCNTCSRTEVGGKMACTMMACFAHGTPYCKAYFDSNAPVACTMEYDPVCGQPPMPKCPAGLSCIQVMPAPKTYSNKCMMTAAEATFIHIGGCEGTDTIYQPQLQ